MALEGKMCILWGPWAAGRARCDNHQMLCDELHVASGCDAALCVPGLTDWEDDEILASVLAVSQQEYLDSMKHQSAAMHREREPSPDSSW